MTAQTKLASIFNNHMVLQRETEVAIWGNDKPNTVITIEGSWGHKAKTVTDNKGNWQTKIKTTSAGGPYSLKVVGSQKVVLEDILLGEVWLCSGQSNMEMPLKGFIGQPINKSNESIMKSENAQLRFFKVKRQTALSPQENLAAGNWEISSRTTAADCSAVAYFYGKMLQETLKIPVGLITSSWGGTVAQAWMSPPSLRKDFPEFDLGALTQEKLNQNSPSALYNGMIHPLVPFGIKGVIWYQGESNKSNPEQYAKLFPALIANWREDFKQGDFPFYFVQIAPFVYSKKENAAFLREAQLKTMQTTKNTGMAVTLDIGEEFSIHPAEKEKVGERLAYWALAKTYGMSGIEFSGPVYKSMEVNGNKATLSFDYTPLGVFSKNPQDFEIAAEDKIFYPATVKITKGKLEVWNDTVAKPVAVRYAWKNFVEGSLFNTAGFPASSFRTDNWEK
ncbi:sialate O-acetylesterase [Flavobacterium sp. NG2]|uniref:sialate O-acetylesterase n=1 Tax=Flavobacterium sp. NG2 TaxID=3097547 RepID=UPI002A7F9610|nr:sialate O-acetylesterase [Flavobacterium sp. NG2]WPR71381.1 sialate O-acetylesterase [Flavobacterium sp. NG2]